MIAACLAPHGKVVRVLKWQPFEGRTKTLCCPPDHIFWIVCLCDVIEVLAYLLFLQIFGNINLV